jgi:hypothetical protein
MLGRLHTYVNDTDVSSPNVSFVIKLRFVGRNLLV